MGIFERPAAALLWEADVPNHVEDVEHHVDTKVRALLAHRSQFETTFGFGDSPDPSVDAVEAFTARVRRQLIEHGALADVAVGEAFHLITDI